MSVVFRIELERETDGRWIAEVVELPGVLAYGASQDDAIARVQALALRVVADRLENEEAGARVPEHLLHRCVSDWPSTRAKLVLAGMRIGWAVGRQTGSHKVLSRPGRPNLVFAFHDREEIGPRMLARIAKHSGLSPEDL
jgi:predicted RNA binding protein YcfA (HicA-like mRNA interferase family)/predicted RNase H-like HicB family nuclease